MNEDQKKLLTDRLHGYGSPEQIEFTIQRKLLHDTPESFLSDYPFGRAINNPYGAINILYPSVAAPPPPSPPSPPPPRYVWLATIRGISNDYDPFHGTTRYENVAWIYHDNNDSNPNSWFESDKYIPDAIRDSNWTFFDKGDLRFNTIFPHSQRMLGGKRKLRRTRHRRKSRRTRHRRKSRRNKHYRKSRRL